MKINEKTGYTWIDDFCEFGFDSLRFRKVVASPKPLAVKEIKTIKTLLDAGQVVIDTGGGGIPVVENADGKLTGVEAVVDKDFASQCLADLIDADLYIILTGVDNAYLNFNQDTQPPIETVGVSQMKTYTEQGHFAPGSMFPKVEATTAFVEHKPEAKAVITSLENLGNWIAEGSGTVIVAD